MNNFMRQGQGGRNRNRNRNRHRGGGGGGGGQGGNKVFDSNGPDVKVRGTAQTIAEKYMQLGRDAQSSGDAVSAESYYQHAEHYYRVWAANQPPGASLIMSRKLGEEEFEDGEDGGEEEAADGQPQGEGQAAAEGTEGPDAAPGEAPVQGDGYPQQPRQFNNNNSNNNNGNGQQRPGRERFRPRWQRNRDRWQQDGANGGQEPNAQPGAPQGEPREAEAGGQWEAPSFLQRPAPAPAPGVEASEPAEPRRPRPRRPREDVPPASAEDGAPQGE